MSTPFYDESAFADAWVRGIKIVGLRFFRTARSPEDGSPVWRYCPDFDRINAEIDVLSTGEAVFLAAMCSFYNADAGAAMLRTLGADSPGGVAAALDEPRRRVIAELTVSYAGW